ncbi:MAG TPA: hypothetical protein VMF70_08215 [Gemmatimonadales bacterium]|nr:hypothetical protein [Gemmatimonadales bacterium]
MGAINFVVSMVSFAAGISLIAFAIAAARRFSAGGATRALHELHDEIQLLRAEIDQLHAAVEETKKGSAALDEIQNRLDFAERLLAQMKAREALPGPR